MEIIRRRTHKTKIEKQTSDHFSHCDESHRTLLSLSDTLLRQEGMTARTSEAVGIR